MAFTATAAPPTPNSSPLSAPPTTNARRTKAGDRARLEASYSDEPTTRTQRQGGYRSRIDGIVNGGNIYERIEYKDRNFGRSRPASCSRRAGQFSRATRPAVQTINDLNYLAVWRRKRWRFLAWQSCKNPPADAKK